VTLSVWILLVIVAAAFILFVSGWLRVDLVGLLVLSALALTGLVSTRDALAGFSSPAVVTVWAMFILSSGLTRTGIANWLGRPLQRFAKGSEALLVAVLMIVASLLSALINTVTVAAILLPSTMELARRSGRPPSRLLMPLALGCMLGGPFTAISTTPNILMADALREAGLRSFGIFEFTPITAAVVAAGTVFVVLVGRHLLPVRGSTRAPGDPAAVGTFYQFETHIFSLHIPSGSPLVGRNLVESRLGSALGLTVLGFVRNGQLILAPRPSNVLQAGDTLIVHGTPEHLQSFRGHEHLRIEPMEAIDGMACPNLAMAEAVVGALSPLVGGTLLTSGLRRQHRVHVVAVMQKDGALVTHLRHHRLAAGDRLMMRAEPEALDLLAKTGLVESLDRLSAEAAGRIEDGHEALLAVRVPSGSVLAGRNLVESRLGNAFGLTVVGIQRDGQYLCMPWPTETVKAGDLLVLQGSPRDLEVLEGLQALELTPPSPGLAAELESQNVGVAEVLLSPRTTLAGKTLGDLLFRDHYGLSVLAIWRKGHVLRDGLQDMALKFGDALLVYGSRRNLEAVARDPDFLVLDGEATRAPRLEKAPVAAVVMIAVILSAILGLAPIAIAAMTGAALMVLFGCLSMDEAYRAIEWKVVFLIASILPLGVAIENVGVARMGAEALIAVVGHLGPRWVVAALFLVTVTAIQVVPPAALVVLMAPVALSAATSLQISPHLLMMTVAMGASASFASPLSHPAHLLVMGPGGYRFSDYLKLGVPVTIVTMLVIVWLLPILFPA
jgi:di/tricarboxylate transporter